MRNRGDPRVMLATTVKTARIMLQVTTKALGNGAVVAMQCHGGCESKHNAAEV
jgi:hypothetical protein